MINHMLDFNDLTFEEWNNIYKLANEISEKPNEYINSCKGKVLATLFYEPSTRTIFSFQTAMLRLGGGYISFSGTENSSVAKGETLKDTIKIVANYADMIAIRHPNDGAAYAASLHSRVPIINAGDGEHLHPTQTMTDMFTIQKFTGRYENLKIGICGDLKYGRTSHSLLKAFELFDNNTFYLISTSELSVPEEFILKLKEKNNKFVYCRTIEECISELDIIYMTRIQKERFTDPFEYERQKNVYILDAEKMKLAREDLIILHPLPKTDEISFEVDDDNRAKYFIQAEFGLYVRMALILNLSEKKFTPQKSQYNTIIKCTNNKCIVNREVYLSNLEKTIENKKVCRYCEKIIG